MAIDPSAPDEDYTPGMNNPDWTLKNNPSFEDNDWYPNASLIGAAGGEYVQQGPIILTADGDKHTFSVQFSRTAGFNEETLYAQGLTQVNGPRLFFRVNSGGTILAIMQSATSNARLLSSSAGGAIAANGLMHHVTVAVDGAADSLDIYVGPTEVTYSTHNAVLGDGYSGLPAGEPDTVAGSDVANAAAARLQATGRIANLKVWRTDFATAANVVTLDAIEEARKGEGFDGLTTSPLFPNTVFNTGLFPNTVFNTGLFKNT